MKERGEGFGWLTWLARMAGVPGAGDRARGSGLGQPVTVAAAAASAGMSAMPRRRCSMW